MRYSRGPISGFICTQCGNRATGTIRNDGIGPYEWQGYVGCDSHWVLLSTCCDAPMFNLAGDPVTPEDTVEDPPECEPCES